MSDNAMHEDSDYEISLVKLNGKQIKDIIGMVSYNSEYRAIDFVLTRIIFDDDTEVGMGGEHDKPFIETYAKWPQPPLESKNLLQYLDAGDYGEEIVLVDD